MNAYDLGNFLSEYCRNFIVDIQIYVYKTQCLYVSTGLVDKKGPSRSGPSE